MQNKKIVSELFWVLSEEVQEVILRCIDNNRLKETWNLEL